MSGEDFRDAIEGAARPTRSDILRAKDLIHYRLAEAGTPLPVSDLQHVLNEADGIGDQRNAKLDLPSETVPGWTPSRHEPAVAYVRNISAARWALAELDQRGSLVPIQEPNDKAVIQVRISGTTSNLQFLNPYLALAPSYCVVGSEQELAVLGDVDLFTADLDALGLNVRTRRCLDEALVAHRQGLYLACVNMLGAAFEGAWYAAGECLRQGDPGLADALDNDRTVKVVQRVSDRMRSVGRLKALANDLQAHAGNLRDLRNYGVHPRERASETEEPVFTELASLALIYQSHRYLVRLAGAVAQLSDPG